MQVVLLRLYATTKAALKWWQHYRWKSFFHDTPAEKKRTRKKKANHRTRSVGICGSVKSVWRSRMGALTYGATQSLIGDQSLVVPLPTPTYRTQKKICFYLKICYFQERNSEECISPQNHKKARLIKKLAHLGIYRHLWTNLGSWHQGNAAVQPPTLPRPWWARQTCSRMWLGYASCELLLLLRTETRN